MSGVWSFIELFEEDGKTLPAANADISFKTSRLEPDFGEVFDILSPVLHVSEYFFSGNYSRSVQLIDGERINFKKEKESDELYKSCLLLTIVIS